MLKTVLFMLLGVSAGFAFATFIGDRDNGLDEVSVPGFSVDAPSVNLVPLTERVGQLESALAEEIAVRESLQAELAALSEQFLDASQLEPVERGAALGDLPGGELTRAEIQERIAERGGGRRLDDPDRRMTQLVDAGFAPADAQRIIERESELRLEALYAQYDAVRTGEPQNFRDRVDLEDQLRDELGDASYERYLEATGQSTSVNIRQVMSGSAGQPAGLQPGDQVVSYGGERVFDTGDLNRLTLQGSPGESVVVDILRDGQPMQIYIPRGPIGITGGGMGGGR
ncbi:MAG: PDZ domain-containing protein, partial [Gammaproteobacteria bacterium]